MRISISNIAWDKEEDENVSQLLCKYNIDAIDIAPSKYFSDFSNTDIKDITKIRNWWGDRGVEIIGMQSLLYGTNGLNLFGSCDVQKYMLKHLEGVCRVANYLDARRLVFGSPRNRDCTGLSNKRAFEIAIIFFQKLAKIAQKYNVVVCLEPNPTCYGSNFMTTSEETAEVVKGVNHPSIKMQLDTGAIAINGENPFQVCREFSSLIGHVHLSDPNLTPLGLNNGIHQDVESALGAFLPEYPVTIEMLVKPSSHKYSILEDSIKFIIERYRKKYP